jgi:hypothetical protein
LIYDFSYRIGGQNACFAIGNGTVQNFAENKGEIKWFQVYNALFINHADGLIEYNYFK